MAKTYKIGDSTIDLSRLLHIGQLQNVHSGRLMLPMSFEFNSTIVIYFNSGENGAPYYHNHEGDWTEKESDFWKFAESEIKKLEEAWTS